MILVCQKNHGEKKNITKQTDQQDIWTILVDYP